MKTSQYRGSRWVFTREPESVNTLTTRPHSDSTDIIEVNRTRAMSQLVLWFVTAADLMSGSLFLLCRLEETTGKWSLVVFRAGSFQVNSERGRFPTDAKGINL